MAIHDKAHDHSLSEDEQALAPVTLAVSSTDDATSATAAPLKSAGGIAAAKKIIGGDNITSTKAGAEVAAKDPTNAGVASAGGSPSIALTAGASFTFTMGLGGSMLFTVVERGSGDVGVFAASFAGSTIVEIADPSGVFQVTDTGTTIAVFKGTNSAVITVKNKSAGAQTIGVVGLGNIASATAPA